MKKRYIFCVLISSLYSISVCASYSNNCLLYVTAMESQKSNTEKIKFKINLAKEYGRADSGCGMFKRNQIISVYVIGGQKIIKGDHFQVVNFEDDFGGRYQILD